MFHFVNCFIGSHTDKIYGRRQLATIKMPAIPSSSLDVVTVRTSENNNDRIIAHIMSSIFKRNDKLCGNDGELFNDNLANYVQSALDFKLSPTQKLRYFHNLFKGKAKSFHRNYVQVMCNTFEEKYAKIQNEFCSIDKQNRV